jgi:hypothetical protein
MEILLVISAAFLVFLLFFLVFSIKNRKSEEPVRIHNCQNCGCGERGSDHLDRFRKQAGKPEGCRRRHPSGADPEFLAPEKSGKGS